jgi:putative tricarboxylic transport membrane protein
MIRVRDPKNLACAALFVAFAIVLAASALSLPIGSASEMGPGFFPLALALILGGLGLLLAFTSLRYEGTPLTAFEWRGFLLVTSAVIAFGIAIRWLGFLPATAITVALCTLASPRVRPWRALLLTVLLVLFCWLIFVRGLGLPVQLMGA